MKEIKVVGGVIVDPKGWILIAQRPVSEIPYKSLKWEFPGGKVEENETPKQALEREIREELDCKVEVVNKIGELTHEYPDFKLRMELFVCKFQEGQTPKPLEHNEIKWVDPFDLQNFDWLEADYQILPLIQKFLSEGKA